MGLCKCRTVTNLFCFEHRKNVCEKCIITDHPQCIVNSYLQWLQDSDFNDECAICKGSLKEGELIRLCCLDLFHLECINAKCNMLPEYTAPAGYTCPTCKKAIIPADNIASPLASIIRVKLADSKWAQPHLPKKINSGEAENKTNNVIVPDYNLNNIQNANFSVNTSTIYNSDILPSRNGLTKPQIYGIRDGDEDKYGTKHNETNKIVEFINSFKEIFTTQHKRKVLYGIVASIFIIFFFLIFSNSVPATADEDKSSKI